jgi:hypothetical protein
VRLFSRNVVRRLRTVGLALAALSAIPVGLSVTGCGHKAAAVVYCNASDTGPVAGQVANISLSPTLATTGLSLNYQQIGQGLSASATDCKGASVSVSRYTYATSNMALVDINPSTGATCAGIWNRNTGGGIADYTVCNPYLVTPTPAATKAVTLTGSPYTYTVTGPGALSITGGTVSSIAITDSGTTTVEQTITTPTTNATSGIFAVETGDTVVITYTAAPTVNFVPSGAVAYVTASAEGATSNAVAVYIHPVVTGIVLGPASTTCTTDPGTDCCPNNTVGTTVTASPYTGSACISQGKTGQLIARIYQGSTTAAANNITCQVGHVSFSPLTSSIVSIDENGIVTANLPGSTLITANVSNSSSATQAGFFSTCPAKNITLTNPSGTGNPVSVNVNTLQPLTAVVTDTNGVTLNGLTLEYNSTSPQTIPATTGSVTPAYPGTANITATCLPSSCNPAPFSQIGLYGNGQPITSNSITVKAVGTASDVIYMGSTSSQYVLPHDFTTGQNSSLVKLPYLPNSMVITQDGSEIYLGSTQGLMSIATATNTVGTVNESVPGKVLSVSPDGTTVVITDPTRQTVSLYTASSSAVSSSYGGTATSAKWSPDSSTVYVTLASVTNGTNTILTHTTANNWQATPITGGADANYADVAVMVPSVGAFFAGATGSLATEARSYCPAGTISTATTPVTVTNNFAPLAAVVTTPTDKVAATTDGLHILGATVQNGTQLADINLSADVPTGTSVATENAMCPVAGQPAVAFTTNFTTSSLASIKATAINGVFPAANSAVSFVTYTGTSGLLPEYIPAATGAGTLKFLTLGNGATAASAPVSGAFSTDGLSFFTGTSGDDQLHIFTISGTTATESSVITPSLPLYTGQTDTGINLLAQKPKKTLN